MKFAAAVGSSSIPERDPVRNLQTLAAEGHPFEWKEYPGLDHPLSDAIWPEIQKWVARQAEVNAARQR